MPGRKKAAEAEKQARDLRNGAFGAYLQQGCIAKQLALSFLKFSAAVDTMLLHWADYMRSEEHAKEKARAQKADAGDAESVLEKERQEKLKMKLHRLRHRIRQMRALHAKKWFGDVSWQHNQRYRNTDMASCLWTKAFCFPPDTQTRLHRKSD